MVHNMRLADVHEQLLEFGDWPVGYAFGGNEINFDEWFTKILLRRRFEQYPTTVQSRMFHELGLNFVMVYGYNYHYMFHTWTYEPMFKLPWGKKAPPDSWWPHKYPCPSCYPNQGWSDCVSCRVAIL